MKRCLKCGETKPLTAFYADKGRRDGYYVECKDCIQTYRRTRREAKAVLRAMEVAPLTRKCRVCGVEKPLNRFRKGKAYKFGRRHDCIDCHTEEMRQYAGRHGPEDRAKKRKRMRVYNLHRWYGLTPDEVERMKAAQGNACALCGKTPAKGLVIDHDHKTGAVRALLCSSCNTGLGHFRDDPALLARAIEYLHRSCSVSDRSA